MNVLVIIPARGGSKGIPRKNLRSLAGKPLVYYSINQALASKNKPDVYVASDDQEILTIAKKIGAKVVGREKSDSNDSATLDPVIYNAYKKIEKIEKKTYDLIITLQPTSPLLSTKSLDLAIKKIKTNSKINTIISAKEDTHLTWRDENGKFTPNYKQRLNRQYLPATFKETGGFLITRSDSISSSSRIGKNVELYVLSGKETIDIDSSEDWSLCEYYLRRKKLLLVVSGYSEIGLGHVYNTLLIANDLMEHEIVFLVDKKSQLAYEKIKQKNYEVYKQKETSIIKDIDNIDPDVVINDKLDNSMEYIKLLKSKGYKVINFEDLGEGASLADLTINAMYAEKQALPNHYFGHKYFVLRDEFLLGSQPNCRDLVKNILISFGGVDPNNYTEKVLSTIYDECLKRNIAIDVILGFGYKEHSTLKKYKKATIHNNVNDISNYMSRSDLIFTSAGRTTYEIASLSVPAIVLAQNKRELTHFFADNEHGFVNLGLGYKVNNEVLHKSFLSLLENFEGRKDMSQKMKECDLSKGRDRVATLIRNEINR